VTTQFYRDMSEVSSSIPFTPAVINRILDQQVEQQAFMLSTNDLSWLAGWIFLALIPILFLGKRVKSSDQPVTPAH
jgi:MFS transporter, DHA2 family, multidrug resistance protein